MACSSYRCLSGQQAVFGTFVSSQSLKVSSPYLKQWAPWQNLRITMTSNWPKEGQHVSARPHTKLFKACSSFLQASSLCCHTTVAWVTNQPCKRKTIQFQKKTQCLTGGSASPECAQPCRTQMTSDGQATGGRKIWLQKPLIQHPMLSETDAASPSTCILNHCKTI